MTRRGIIILTPELTRQLLALPTDVTIIGSKEHAGGVTILVDCPRLPPLAEGCVPMVVSPGDLMAKPYHPAGMIPPAKG